MIYNNIIEGIFIKRINRFIADVLIDGKRESVHVKNTGRCKELFIEGAKIYLEKSNNPNRKTKYSLISIYKEENLINIDSQVPNAVVFEALQQGRVEEIDGINMLKREVTYEKSRFDLYYERGGKKGFIEVKGATLENNGVAMFPDAPTVRGYKHIMELIKAKEEGYEATLFFLVQMQGVHTFIPNRNTDENFSNALIKAKKAGVNVLVYDSIVTKNSIELNKRIQYK